MIGHLLLIVAMILYLFQVIDILKGVGLLFVWVGGLFELILPAWLIVKGFNVNRAQVECN